MAYHYRLKSTKHSSAKFGACEVCGAHVSEVYVQAEERDMTGEALAKCAKLGIAVGRGRTYADCRTHTFGHEACLKGLQR